MGNFTFLKFLINTKNRKFNIFLVCIVLLSCANKSYANAHLFSTPVLDGFQVTSSSGNLSFFQQNEVNSTVYTGMASFVIEGIADAFDTQNTFFITII